MWAYFYNWLYKDEIKIIMSLQSLLIPKPQNRNIYLDNNKQHLVFMLKLFENHLKLIT